MPNENDAKTKISKLRSKLNSIVESGDLYKGDILKISREMDSLVVEYYNSKSNEYKNAIKVAK